MVGSSPTGSTILSEPSVHHTWRIIAEVRPRTPGESDPAVIMFFDPVEGVVPTVHNHPMGSTVVHNIWTGPGGDPDQALWYEVNRLCLSYAKSPRKRR